MLPRTFPVIATLLAAVGGEGIPDAGTVTMIVMLRAVGLPLEVIPLILAVDRPLDMCRTGVNVCGDAVGAAVIARTEGGKLFAEGEGCPALPLPATVGSFLEPVSRDKAQHADAPGKCSLS